MAAAIGLAIVPPATAQPTRARTLVYDTQRKEWVEQPPPPMGTPAGELHAIRRLNRDGEFKTALSEVAKFTKRYGTSEPLHPELLIARAQAFIGLKKYTEAHTVLQTFLSEYGGMSATPEAIRLEFIIAEAFLAGAKRKIAGLKLFSGIDLAYNILDDIASNHPDTRLAELAIKTKADHLFQTGDHALAELEYARLIQAYPQSRYYMYCLHRAADAALAKFAGVDYDEAPLVNAAERYREYQAANPEEADHEGIRVILNGIRESRAEKVFNVGRYYERTGHLSSAAYYYDLVRQDWADTVAATKAATRLELMGTLETMPSSVTQDAPQARPDTAPGPTP